MGHFIVWVIAVCHGCIDLLCFYLISQNAPFLPMWGICLNFDSVDFYD